jgi:hypothetical protein
MLYNLLCRYFTNVCYKLECLLTLIFTIKSGAYPRVEALKPANIRLGWKGLSGTNTVAYYELTFINYGHKKFFNVDTWGNVIKHFLFMIYRFMC